METFLQDLRYGVRMLLKKPGFTVVAVLTLALGIGANTAIFSVINGVLLRSLPYTEPERLVALWETNPKLGTESRNRNEVAMGNFLDWRSQNESFEQVGALYYTNVNLTGTGEPEQIQSAIVTVNLFETLGLQPVNGRSFLSEEEKPGSPRVVVVSHELWQRRFGSDPNLVGKTFTLNGNPSTVVGIMPPGFELQFPTNRQVEMWLPMRIDTANADRKAHYLYVLGRLKKEASLEQAQSEMTAIAARLQQKYPDTNAEKGANVIALQSQLIGDVRSYLYVLFAAVGFVLLIACANVANLLLVRVSARHKEIAIRQALGASRGRLIRQLLTEALALSFIGGLLGLLLARWGIDLLVALTPSDVPRLGEIRMHTAVFGWTFAVSLLAGVLFGLAPALQASKPDLNESLKESSGRSTGGVQRNRIRSLLVISEVALALVLLIGAGLMIKSFMRLQQVKPGFEPDGLLTMSLSLPRQKYNESQKANLFFDQLFERIKTVPGVEAVGGTDPLPLSNSNATTGFVVEGGPLLPMADRPEVGERAVTPGYFETMRIPVLKGRSFTEQDRSNTPLSVIVNEALARRYWPDEEVIGKRLGFNESDKQDWYEIVGIVGNVKHDRLAAEPKPELFFAYRQYPKNFMSLVVRASSDPANLSAALREQVLAVDPDQPVFDIKTMNERMSKSMAQNRFVMLLLTIFSALALILAAVGIYGVMSYAVTQRTHEIGIRLALGAQTGDVLKMVVGQGLALTLAGVAAGVVGAVALTRLMSSLLFEVSATDWLTFMLVALLLTGVALAACFVPARRATRVDPMVALRHE
jgi:putative ABC transport system permease protein